MPLSGIWEIDLYICFPRVYPLRILPPEARQSFTHDIDHGLGRPAVPAIVAERESQDLTIYRRDVPGQRNDVVGGSCLGVEVSLGWGVPHPPLEELGVTGHRERCMEPRPP